MARRGAIAFDNVAFLPNFSAGIRMKGLPDTCRNRGGSGPSDDAITKKPPPDLAKSGGGFVPVSAGIGEDYFVSSLFT